MNRFLKKAAAALTAGILTASAMGVSAFADEAKFVCTSEATVAYEATVAKPTYSVKGSKGVRKIKLSTTTSGATIYYTTNGTTPTTSSKKLSSGALLQIKKDTKIKAIAVKNGTKSAVMTKTFKVSTVPGDVTGDGNINSTDYTRLKKYLNGENVYICTDNADTSGNGSVAKKDLTLLSQYLNGQIKSFPASGGSSSSSVTAPNITIYKAYGGKNVELTCSDSGATIYYTTNGKNPTNTSSKYKSKFLVEKNTTVKYVSYKNGKYSSIKTKEVEVPQCKAVTSDTPDSKEYTQAVSVKLSCATDASTKIYYTVDGTNPASSTASAYLYRNPIKLSKSTTLKAYAMAKGYSDSVVSTFKYNINDNADVFTISGAVWDDTPNESSTADGKRSSNEAGINGLSVSLLNVDRNTIDFTTSTTTINGVSGSYTFNKAKKGTRYKVVFYFNGQRYRAFDKIVSGGNQAISDSIPTGNMLTIDNSGAHATSSNVNIPTGINSYSSAINNSAFVISATTSSYYSTETKNVDLALSSNIYGKMKLSLAVTRLNNYSYSSNTKVRAGDKLTYQLSLKNDSPSTSIASASARIYVPENKFNVSSSNARYITTKNGYDIYDIDDFVTRSIAKGNSYSYDFDMTVASGIKSGDKLDVVAEITSYKYANSTYDKTSVPGSIYAGLGTSNKPSARQDDEASVTVNTEGSAKKLKVNFTNKDKKTLIVGGDEYTVEVSIENGDKYQPENDLIITWVSNDCITRDSGAVTTSGSTVTIPYKFRADKLTSTAKTFIVKLKDDQAQCYEISFTTEEPPKPPVTISAAGPNSPVNEDATFTISVTVENPRTDNNPVTVDYSGNLSPSGGNWIVNNGISGNKMTLTYTFKAGSGTDAWAKFSVDSDGTTQEKYVTIKINPSSSSSGTDSSTSP